MQIEGRTHEETIKGRWNQSGSARWAQRKAGSQIKPIRQRNLTFKIKWDTEASQKQNKIINSKLPNVTRATTPHY